MENRRPDYEIIRGAVPDARRPVQPKKKSKKVYIILAALTVLGIAEVYVSNNIIDTDRISVKITGLPSAFNGFRIAHISDLHAVQFGENNIGLAELIAEEKADIIVITGDYIDGAKDTGMVYETAKTLCAVAPVYYVPGNHEYGSRKADVVFSLLERAGVTVLRNQSAMLERDGEGLLLLGIDDPNGPRDMISMERAIELARTKAAGPIIMLNHRYDRAEEIARYDDIALALTGHAHGGLIRLPFTDGIVGPGRVLFPKYTNGYYEIDGLKLVTSRGLGNAGVTFRMFNKPHLPIITLVSG